MGCVKMYVLYADGCGDMSTTVLARGGRSRYRTCPDYVHISPHLGLPRVVGCVDIGSPQGSPRVVPSGRLD